MEDKCNTKCNNKNNNNSHDSTCYMALPTAQKSREILRKDPLAKKIDVKKAIRRYAEIQSQFTDVYFYQFSYFGEMSRFTEIDLPGAGKVPHAGDNHYLWTINNNSNVHIYPDADALTSQRYVKLFTDFSKYLNPTPEETSLMQNLIWPKVNSSYFLYLDIDENLEVKLNPKDESYTGWVDVYDTWAVKPYDTY